MRDSHPEKANQDAGVMFAADDKSMYEVPWVYRV